MKMHKKALEILPLVLPAAKAWAKSNALANFLADNGDFSEPDSLDFRRYSKANAERSICQGFMSKVVEDLAEKSVPASIDLDKMLDKAMMYYYFAEDRLIGH